MRWDDDTYELQALIHKALEKAHAVANSVNADEIAQVSYDRIALDLARLSNEVMATREAQRDRREQQRSAS